MVKNGIGYLPLVDRVNIVSAEFLCVIYFNFFIVTDNLGHSLGPMFGQLLESFFVKFLFIFRVSNASASLGF